MPDPGIVEVGEVYGARTSSINKMWQREYTRSFHVETSGPEVGALRVRAATGIPQIGHVYDNGLDPADPLYEDDPGAYVVSIESAMDTDPEHAGRDWTVTVTYGPFQPFDIDPSLWPIKVSFGGERTEKVISRDKSGGPIVNSAGDPFDPPITIDDSRSTMTVTRNERVSSFDLTLAEQYRDKINSADWNGFEALSVKCGIISTSEPQYDSNARVYYYTVTYPFTIDRKGWLKDILDAGCNELDPDRGLPRPIMRQGQQVSDPVPLDGAGHALDPTYGYTEPNYITIDCYESVDFSGLNIDLSTRLGA